MKAAAAAAAVLAVCLLMFCADLGRAPLNTKGEPRVGLQVQEQLRGGGWILPRLNGRWMPSKPPLFPWLAGVTSLAAGAVDEWTLRFPSAVLATAVALLIFVVTMHRGGIVAGLAASVVLATSFEWLRAARVARVDMTHTAFMIGAFVAFELAATGPVARAPFVALFYLCMGLAALAKGPVGIVLPLIVGLIYLLVTRDLGRLRQLHLIPGLAATFVIAGSWYGLALASGGGAFAQVVYEENVLRFLSRSADGAAHVHPLYYYLPGFLAGFLPWSPFLALLAVWLFRTRDTLRARRLLYPLIWLAAVLLFYSASAGKRSVYILPAYPAAALLLGVWWGDVVAAATVLPATVARSLRALGLVTAVLLALVLVAVLVSALGASPLGVLAPILHARDQANLPFVQEIVRTYWGILALGLAALLVTTLLFMSTVERRGWSAVLLWLVVVSGGIAWLVNAVFQPALAERRSVKPFLAGVRESVGDAPLGFYRRVDLAAAFYADRHLVPIAALGEGHDNLPRYILMWEEDWQGLQPQEQERFEPVRESEPTESRGRRRLLLLRSR